MVQTFDELQKLGKEGFDAALESFAAGSKGTQLFLGECADYARRSFEQGSSAFEKLAGIRTPEQAAWVHGELARDAFADFVAQTKRFGELWASVARQAYAPIESYIGKLTPQR